MAIVTKNGAIALWNRMYLTAFESVRVRDLLETRQVLVDEVRRLDPASSILRDLGEEE